MLVMTGMLNAATILLGGEGHDTPLYLVVLGAKLVLVAVMVSLALDQSFSPVAILEGSAEVDGSAAAMLFRNIRVGNGVGIDRSGAGGIAGPVIAHDVIGAADFLVRKTS